MIVWRKKEAKGGEQWKEVFDSRRGKRYYGLSKAV
jgi:hypothetical protein